MRDMENEEKREIYGEWERQSDRKNEREKDSGDREGERERE